MTLAWWQQGVVYQVYPRSFMDSDGDGTGDLRGLLQRLDHFTWLGVDAVWLSPVYPSPMTDFGYDVADYCGIDPLFGTLADFGALAAGMRARGLKLILDFVPNHTSDRHPWFVESRAGGDKRDWYIWRDAAPGGGPPNNWRSNFGGPAWTWDAGRGQYYYHSFLPTQPDLNLRRDDVLAALHEVLRFWLRRGVDGFRVDVMWMLIKDDQFRDNPVDASGAMEPLYTTDRPEVQAVVAGFRQVLDEFLDRVLIGELYLPISRLVAYYGQDGRGAQMPFNFSLLLLQDWSAAAVAGLVRDYEAALPAGAWPNWVLGNHDRPRVASRVGPAQARVAAMLLLTLRGTPTIYMGEELGMVNAALPAAALRDPAELRQPGQGEGRDPERTPFPWTGGPGGGFTTGTPWLPLGQDEPLDRQAGRLGSMVRLYRALLALRRRHPALIEGTITDVSAVGPVLHFQRAAAGQRLFIALNLSGVPASCAAPPGTVLLSTHQPGGQGVGVLVQLGPDEGVIVAVA